MARRRKKTYAQQKLEETLELGLALAEPRCAYFGECGGCAWQPVAYDRQLEFKREWVERAFHEQGFTDVKIPLPLPSPDQYGYRNKMEFSFASRRWLTRAEIDSGEPLRRDFALGLHAKGAFDRVIDIADCPLQSETANAYLRATRQFALESGESPYALRAHTGFFRYLILRHGFYTDQTLVVLVTSQRKPELMRKYVEHLHKQGLKPTTVANGVTDRLASTSEGSDLTIDFGENAFQERLGEWSFDLSPDAFFQPNTRAAEHLCNVVREFAQLTGSETVLDLYCGVGAFSLVLAPHAKTVVGIEKAESSVKSARTNAQANGVENALFLAGDLDAGLTLLPPDLRPEVVVTDPPRAGMHPNTLRALKDLAPSRIISVSCHPVPQAENVQVLCAGGNYFIADVQPVDLFPHTPHVENVVLLMRESGA